MAMLPRVRPETLDHVALWVAERDPIADFVTEPRRDARRRPHRRVHAGRLGRAARQADALRGRGAARAGRAQARRAAGLELAAALGALDGTQVERPRDGEAYFDVSEGLRLGLVEAPTEVEYDLDHVALWSRSPEETAEEYRAARVRVGSPGPADAPRVEVGGAFVEFHQGEPGDPERPLLNHLAVLVDSADEHIAEARELGLEIDDIVDAANTYAVFVWGPERVKVEYVEHKPTFSLT